MSAALALPPAHVVADGRTWTVRRAWPGRDGRTDIEAVSDDGTVRAGFAGRGAVELLPAGRDPKLPALRGAAASGSVVSHRPAKRAVVRSRGGRSFVKVVRPGRSAAVLDGVRCAAPFDGPFRTPAVLAHDGSSIEFETLSGRSLHGAGDFSPQQWERAWDQVLGAWASAVTGAAALGGASEPPVHDGDAEARVLRTWRDRAQGLMGSERSPFASAVESAAARLVDAGGGAEGLAPVPSHRDLHDKQLLWDEDAGPALLDVDTACLAPAALDLGNLRAHARWRARQGVWTRRQAGVVMARLDAAALAAGVRPDELALYELSALLRLGCVYAFRPRWAGTAKALRQEASRDAGRL